MSETFIHDSIEYRKIDGYPGYAVSQCGKVISRMTLGKRDQYGKWNILKGSITSRGYCDVGLSQPIRRKIFIHRLVLLTWIGPYSGGKDQCCHVDGNKLNNHISNLRWGSSQDNHDDQKRHGTVVRGSKHGRAKLTETSVQEIRRLAGEGCRQKILAKRFNVSRRAISRVISRKSWTHI